MQNLDVQQVWRAACELLQHNLSPYAYDTWILSNSLTELRLVGDDRAIGVITSPTAFHSTNTEKNFYAQIKEVLDQVTGRRFELQFRVGTPQVMTQVFRPTQVHSVRLEEVTPSLQTSPESFADQLPETAPPPSLNNNISTLQDRLKALAQHSRPSHTESPKTSQHSATINHGLFSQQTMQSMAVDRAKMQAQKAGLRLDYTFETFAVSTTNEMAHAAALAVSNQPGTAYNPLFIYGGVGVGKTHLMHAVGNNILKSNPDMKVLYCTGEDFTNEIVKAIQTKKAMQFKEKYRTVDVLLIDDVQFIAGKNTIQEEFFHTFNAITKRAGQIILTSDRPPQEISLLEDRLRSRFEAGLMVDIQQPSFELRTAILLIKASAYQFSLPMNLAQIIASKVDSARKIEGIIKTIRSEVELKHQEITPELIESILKNDTEKVRERLRVKPYEVIKTVADYYHLKPMVVRGTKRVKSLVRARHVAMYFLKHDLQLPYMEIGRWFSDRDHTSVMHAVNKIEQEDIKDNDLRIEIASIRSELTKKSR